MDANIFTAVSSGQLPTTVCERCVRACSYSCEIHELGCFHFRFFFAGILKKSPCILKRFFCVLSSVVISVSWFEILETAHATRGVASHAASYLALRIVVAVGIRGGLGDESIAVQDARPRAYLSGWPLVASPLLLAAWDWMCSL